LKLVEEYSRNYLHAFDRNSQKMKLLPRKTRQIKWITREA